MKTLMARREWLVLAAVSAAFFFLNAATFTSLGVVLYSMLSELHWSQTAAGFSFSLLGIACGLSSPLPAILMKRIGGRWTMVLGAAVLALGFLLAGLTHGLVVFYLATTLLGIGYSLCGNVPGVFLIAGWFPQTSSRMIGFYLMTGAFGAVVGPPLVQGIMSVSGGWRGHWGSMAAVALLLCLACWLLVRDRLAAAPAGAAVEGAAPAAEADEWSDREAIWTPQFLLVSASMAMTMACLTTVDSVAVSHLVQRGGTPAFAAMLLSLVAMLTTIAKGASGWLCERISASLLLAAGIGLQALGMLAFGFAGPGLVAYLFILSYGAGWGISYVAATILLLNYFGPRTGSRILAVVWLLTTVAAAGPLVAGVIADRFGTFSPIFEAYAVILLLMVVPLARLRKPVKKAAQAAPAVEAVSGAVVSG